MAFVFAALITAMPCAVAEAPPGEGDTALVGDVYLDAGIAGKLAATLAATLANAEAKKKFDVELFSPANAKAVFHHGRWEWKSRVGYGKGDLTAIVSFAQDGSQPKVEIAPLTNEVRQRF